MTVTRFIAVRFKDTDEKSEQFRKEFFQKHVKLYESRSYVSNVQGECVCAPLEIVDQLNSYMTAKLGGNQPLGQGYHVRTPLTVVTGNA